MATSDWATRAAAAISAGYHRAKAQANLTSKPQRCDVCGVPTKSKTIRNGQRVCTKCR